MSLPTPLMLTKKAENFFSFLDDRLSTSSFPLKAIRFSI